MDVKRATKTHLDVMQVDGGRRRRKVLPNFCYADFLFSRLARILWNRRWVNRSDMGLHRQLF